MKDTAVSVADDVLRMWTRGALKDQWGTDDHALHRHIVAAVTRHVGATNDLRATSAQLSDRILAATKARGRGDDDAR